jgi:hypothetical protein
VDSAGGRDRLGDGQVDHANPLLPLGARRSTATGGDRHQLLTLTVLLLYSKSADRRTLLPPPNEQLNMMFARHLGS